MARIFKTRDLPPKTTTIETIEVRKPSHCRSSGLLAQYRGYGTPRERFANLTFGYLAANEHYLPIVKFAALGYSGLCAKYDSRSLTLTIFEGNWPTAGCFGGRFNVPSRHAKQFFKLTIENSSGIRLSTFSADSYCIVGMPSGTLAAGETKTYSFETYRGNYRCDFGADFTADYNPTGSVGDTRVAINWAWTASNVNVAGRGYKGYCVKKVADATLKFYKAGASGC